MKKHFIVSRNNGHRYLADSAFFPSDVRLLGEYCEGVREANNSINVEHQCLGSLKETRLSFKEGYLRNSSRPLKETAYNEDREKGKFDAIYHFVNTGRMIDPDHLERNFVRR